MNMKKNRKLFQSKLEKTNYEKKEKKNYMVKAHEDDPYEDYQDKYC